MSISPSIYSILSLSERNFSLKFHTSGEGGLRMGKLILDGELSEHVVKKQDN